MTTQPEVDTQCCPKFNPAPWDDAIVEWNNKLFIKDHIFTLFYIPINFKKVMKLLDEKVKRAGAKIPDGLCLSDHTSPWNMDIYCAVDKEVAGAVQTTLSGTFYSRVYEGSFGNISKWRKNYKPIAMSRGYAIEKWFMWYTTCPECAKKYGKNFVVILCRIR